MASLGRWNEARRVYGYVLKELDCGNLVAKRGLEDCRVREERGREERERELARLAKEENRRQEGETKRTDDHGDNDTNEKKDKVSADTQELSAGDKVAEGGDADEDEDDLLNDFFDDVEEATAKKSSNSHRTYRRSHHHHHHHQRKRWHREQNKNTTFRPGQHRNADESPPLPQ